MLSVCWLFPTDLILHTSNTSIQKRFFVCFVENSRNYPLLISADGLNHHCCVLLWTVSASISSTHPEAAKIKCYSYKTTIDRIPQEWPGKKNLNLTVKYYHTILLIIRQVVTTFPCSLITLWCLGSSTLVLK